LHHSLAPVKALTPKARKAAKAQERRLLRQEGTDKHKDPKDPTKLVRDAEIWEVSEWFPKTVLGFKELQFSGKLISLWCSKKVLTCYVNNSGESTRSDELLRRPGILARSKTDRHAPRQSGARSQYEHGDVSGRIGDELGLELVSN